MAVTSFVYGQYCKRQFGGSSAVDWVNDTIKILLTTSAYTPDQDAHTFRSDVTNEVTGSGYTAGGLTLATKSVVYDAPTNETRLIAADPTWSAVTVTARRAVIYKSTGTASTDPLIGWVDFGADQSPAGITFVIDFDQTAGIFKATAI